MNLIAAIISGLAGTLAMSMLMAAAPKMGLPKMDIVGMLSSMFGKPNRTLGWVLHFMMGSVFAIIYTALWSFGVGTPNLIYALVFGAVHWVVAGLTMPVVPAVHAGIKGGEVAAPGPWMINQGGLMSFVGGLMGHMVYAIVVVSVFTLL